MNIADDPLRPQEFALFCSGHRLAILVRSGRHYPNQVVHSQDSEIDAAL